MSAPETTGDRAEVVLHDVVGRLASAFVHAEGRVFLTPDAIRHWRQEMSEVPGGERQAVATDLVALAVKFHRVAGEQAIDGIAQLLALAGALLQDGAKARALFEQGPEALKEAARRVAQTPDRGAMPAGLAPPSTSKR